MKIGICSWVNSQEGYEAGVDKMRLLLDWGADYIEPSVAAVAALSEEEFIYLCSLFAQKKIAFSAANGLFPGTMALVGPHVDWDQIHSYLELGFSRLKRLGISKAVFGSGQARQVPDGFSKDEALGQLAGLCRKMALLAKKYHITVAIEPLNTKECNIINTVEEGFRLVKAANCKEIRLLADLYHICENKEPMDYAQEVIDSLEHVHMSEPGNRRVPDAANPQVKAFADGLLQGGYDKTVSFEGRWENFEADAKDAINAMRILFQRNG